MKKVKIDWTGALCPINVIYENLGVKFSWLGPGIKKDTFSQITTWYSCRETFAGEICKFVDPLPKWKYDRNLDLKKAYVAVARKHGRMGFVEKTKADLKWMKCSVRILNILEKTQGWALTRVSMCDNPELHAGLVNTFVFVSSPKWIQAPQLLSLYLLIIRLGQYWQDFHELKKIEDLKKVVNSIISDKSKKLQADIQWLEMTWKYWLIILNNHDELFFKRTIEENYVANSGKDGIKSLIDCSGSDQQTKKCWKDIISKTKGGK